MTASKVLSVSSLQLLMCDCCVRSCLIPVDTRVCVPCRGSESGPGGRDPLPTESDGERDREEDLWNRGSASLLYHSIHFCVCMWVRLSHSAPSLFVADAAFLAREKAKADAEYYTAAKSAEANRVKGSADTVSNINTRLSTTPKPCTCLSLSLLVTVEVNPRIPAADEVPGHSS